MKILTGKKILLVSIFFMAIKCSLAQGLNNAWMLGYSSNGRALLNFNTAQPTLQSLGNLNISFMESFAGICNKNGELLFYTNGVKINNATNQTMQNGSGLNPGPFASNSMYGLSISGGQIVIPFPNDSNKYYLFHETVDFNGNTAQPFHLFYSTIDMMLDSGRGAVIQKNIPLINDTLVIGEISATKHANGRDWWITSHRSYSNIFWTFLVTPSGISNPTMQQIGGIFTQGGGGQASFSPNGKRYARYHFWDGLDIYDFDRCSGVFSNWQHCDSIGNWGGLSFSNNSNVLYVSATENLYQFDLSDTTKTLQQRKFLIAQWDTFYSPNPPLATTYYLQQLAPNGKIYINSNNGTNRLHIISSPDSLGLACNFIQHGLLLPCLNGSTIPNYPNYFLGADSGSVCDTLMLSIYQAPKINPLNDLTYIIKPNPTKDNLNIAGNLINSELRIMNPQGLIVYKTKIQSNDELNLNTSSFANGVYFISIQNSNGESMKKIVIIR